MIRTRNVRRERSARREALIVFLVVALCFFAVPLVALAQPDLAEPVASAPDLAEPVASAPVPAEPAASAPEFSWDNSAHVLQLLLWGAVPLVGFWGYSMGARE